MPTNRTHLVDFSLTNECLRFFEEKNKNIGNLNSFKVVLIRVAGSACSAGAALSDTLIQLIVSIVKVVSGSIVSPVNLVSDKRLSENWDWSRAIKHLGQSLKHLTAIFIVPVITLRSGPAEARKFYFSKIVLQEKYDIQEALCIQQQKVIQDQRVQIAKLKKQVTERKPRMNADKPITPTKLVNGNENPKNSINKTEENPPPQPPEKTIPTPPNQIPPPPGMSRPVGGPPPPPPPPIKPATTYPNTGEPLKPGEPSKPQNVQPSFSLADILDGRKNLRKVNVC